MRRSLLVMAFIIAMTGVARSAPIVLSPGGPDSAAVLAAADAAPGNASAADVKAGRVRWMPAPKYKASGWPVSLWLRFSIESRYGNDRPVWLLALPEAIENAEFYRSDGSVQRSGSGIAMRQRPEHVYLPAFAVSDRDMHGAPLYLHVVYYPEIPFSVRLTTERRFFLRTESYRIVETLFIGVLIAIAFFNLFVYRAVRDRSALLYVVYVCALMANEIAATGFGEQYVWPQFGINIRLLTYLTSIASFTAFLFFERAFLQTREEAPACDRALLVAYGAYAVLQLAQVFIPGGNVLVAPVLCAAFGGMLVTIAVAIIRWRAGYHPSRFFVLAFAPATVGVFANLWYAAFPQPGPLWFWAANGVEVGTALQSIVLSFSIIDRLRLLQSETRRTRTELSAISAHAKKMQTLASFDPLTGLANRMRFTEELNRTLRHRSPESKPLAVLFCDLNDFKGINDIFGHRFGDEVLKVVAARLSASLRAGDLLARLGGDEFAVLLKNVTEPQQADRIAELLSHLLDDPIVLEGKVMPIGISVGRALFPDDGLTMDQLLHVADLRMYQMKQMGKANVS